MESGVWKGSGLYSSFARQGGNILLHYEITLGPDCRSSPSSPCATGWRWPSRLVITCNTLLILPSKRTPKGEPKDRFKYGFMDFH